MKSSLRSFLLVVSLQLSCLAQVQLSTLNKPGGINANIAANVFEAFAFTTGPEEYSLNSITFSLRHNGSAAESGELLADLFISNGAGLPTGSSLLSFNTTGDLTTAGVFQDIVFSPDDAFTLASGTQYVFVLSATPATWPGWVGEFTAVSDGYDIIPGNGWTMFSGRPNRSDDTLGGAWHSDGFFRAVAAVDASVVGAIPEPSVSALVIGLAVLGAACKFRRYDPE